MNTGTGQTHKYTELGGSLTFQLASKQWTLVQEENTCPLRTGGSTVNTGVVPTLFLYFLKLLLRLRVHFPHFTTHFGGWVGGIVRGGRPVRDLARDQVVEV
jgi:hypothetical protein